jgi:aerobic C4-dicarboxylate transport protein
LILPIDWFVGIARAITNLIGNCVATVVIGAWESVLTDRQSVSANRRLGVDEVSRFCF